MNLSKRYIVLFSMNKTPLKGEPSPPC